jgi:flagellar protein FliO/FliZ
MDLDQIMRGLLALVFVLGLIGGITLLAKRFGFTPRATLPKRSRRSIGGQKASSGRRLAIVEVLPVDAKRRLVLIRRDDKEHLIMLGADRELLIESGATSPDLTDAAPDEDSQNIRSLRGNGPGGQI